MTASAAPRVAGFLVALVARVWLATLRVQILGGANATAAEERPWVLVFFHGQQFPLLAWPRRRRTVAMVSLSKDGALQATVLQRLGLGVARGSTSRGAVRALVAIVRALRHERSDGAFAVDGPRGPRYAVKHGAAAAARAAAGVLVPLASASKTKIVFRRTWCGFELPLPFTRTVVAVGTPIEPSHDLRVTAAAVHEALMALRERAERALQGDAASENHLSYVGHRNR